MATDLARGIAVEREGTPHCRHEGQTCCFCSSACGVEFAISPSRSLRLTS
ncbi:MAG TPA: hypothetical protein VKD66_09190 [Streptosporangiaceae bacterium]|nr:hypothetical protein [Streptosporangiaceae bacterium]